MKRWDPIVLTYLVLVLAASFPCGCKTSTIKELAKYEELSREAIAQLLELSKLKREKDTDRSDELPDPVDVSKIESDRAFVLNWPATEGMTIKWKGGKSKVEFIQEATKHWPGVENVAASAHVLMQFPDGKLIMAQYDYVRPGGGGWNRKSVPWEDKLKVGKKRYSMKDASRIGFMLSGLCRDQRRNVDERTPIVWGE